MMADGTGTEREEQDWVLLYGQAGERWCVWGLNIGGERDGWEGKPESFHGHRIEKHRIEKSVLVVCGLCRVFGTLAGGQRGVQAG